VFDKGVDVRKEEARVFLVKFTLGSHEGVALQDGGTVQVMLDYLSKRLGDGGGRSGGA
jgi:hypothetical protein